MDEEIYNGYINIVGSAIKFALDDYMHIESHIQKAQIKIQQYEKEIKQLQRTLHHSKLPESVTPEQRKSWKKRLNYITSRRSLFRIRIYNHRSAEAFLFGARIEYLLNLLQLDVDNMAGFIRSCALRKSKFKGLLK